MRVYRETEHGNIDGNLEERISQPYRRPTVKLQESRPSTERGWQKINEYTRERRWEGFL